MEITSPNYEVGFQYLLAWISPVSETKSMQDTRFPGCVFYRLTQGWGQISWTLLCSWFLIIPTLTQSVQSGVRFPSSSDLVRVRFLTRCSYSRLRPMCRDRVRPSVSASESEHLGLLQCDLSRKTLMAKTNRCWFCCICAWCLPLTQTNHPNGPRPSFRPKHWLKPARRKTRVDSGVYLTFCFGVWFFFVLFLPT